MGSGAGGCHGNSGGTPKKGQRKQYSGKKKRHTLKSQLILHPKSHTILATAFAPGKVHDFELFTRSGVEFSEKTCCLADSGYQGLQKLHENSQTPRKKSKHHPLTSEEKAGNRALARQRIGVEHVIRRLKVFRLLSERYRNRRKRFSLRFNLIAGLYNYELSLG